jgi:hypothetical protein
MSFRHIHARHARHHHRGGFVVVRAEFHRHVLGPNPIASLGANEHHFITYPYVRDVRHVDYALIHAHPADNGRSLAAHQTGITRIYTLLPGLGSGFQSPGVKGRIIGCVVRGLLLVLLPL